MKRLVGGVFLLCLTSMILTLSEDGETYTNITQPEILEQLTNLKNYVSNPKMIKPVWVQLKNGDEIVVVQGEIKKSLVANEFDICISINGYKLVINVTFTQVLNDNNEPMDDWYIDTNDAKYLFTSDAQSIGAIPELPVFENIVDAQGHKRFVEGDITDNSLPEGFTLTFGKWSLSGSHLMIVISESANNESVMANGGYVYFNLPTWIKDKIVVLFGDSEVLKQTFAWYADNDTQQNQIVYLEKGIYSVGGKDYNFRLYQTALTLTNDRKTRIAFDLLIDNEEPEQTGE